MRIAACPDPFNSNWNSECTPLVKHVRLSACCNDVSGLVPQNERIKLQDIVSEAG